MILDDLADYLTTGGVATSGTNLFVGSRMPDTPNELIMLRLYSGIESIHVFGESEGEAELDQPRFQAEVRSTTYQSADSLCRSVRNRLDRAKFTINGKLYHHIEALNSDPLPLDVDESRRYSVVMNFQVKKAR